MNIVAKYGDGVTKGKTNLSEVIFNATSIEEAHTLASTSILRGGKQPVGHLLQWLVVDGELVWEQRASWIRPPASVE